MAGSGSIQKALLHKLAQSFLKQPRTKGNLFRDAVLHLIFNNWVWKPKCPWFELRDLKMLLEG